MDQQQCQSCGMRNSCKEAYKKLGESEAPNVLTKVILAFLLPLILFILSIVMGERLLIEKLKSEKSANLAAFAAAVIMVFLYLLVIKIFNSLRKKHYCSNKKI
ncbi:MAG: SoxR reducing system RseC family protein [Phycisphaerales bacterium]